MPRKDHAAAARSARSRRAAALKDLESGKTDIRTLLRDPPKAIEDAELYYVLLKVPKLGKTGVRQVCERAQVWPHYPIGRLVREEIEAIIEVLPKRIT